MGSSQGLFLVILKDNIEKQCCSFFWWVKWSLQKGNDQSKTTQPKNSRIRNRTKSRLDIYQGSSQQTILFIVSPRIISPFIRTMSTKKELQEIASYVASLSESQGKWPGHLNIPRENVPWILEPHNHPNSVDLSSFSQVVGSVSQGPTNTQLAEQLTPTSHRPQELRPHPHPGHKSSGLPVRYQSMRGAWFPQEQLCHTAGWPQWSP